MRPNPADPWVGLGPLQFATLTGRLSAEVAAALGDEAGGPRGSFLPVPKPGDDPTLAGFRSAIRGAAGKLLTVESGDLGATTASADGGQSEQYKPRRFGAHVSASDGGAFPAGVHRNPVVRAAWRRRFSSTPARNRANLGGRFSVRFIAPLARIVEAELQRGLGAEVGLSFADLRASDLQARARSFQAMVTGGKTVAEAATLAGLMLPEDDD